MSSQHIIKKRESTILSPWVTLRARTVVLDGGGAAEIYHSLQQADYVTVLAVTSAEEIVLVKQFRSALESFTLELPGGLRDAEEDPASSAARELEEEAGFRCTSPLNFLGNLVPDSGRLENRLWCYYAGEIEPIPTWQPEQGVERLLVPKQEYLELIRSGTFTMALHIAATALAILKNKLNVR